MRWSWGRSAAYAPAVQEESLDRRARKKAQTRREVKEAAQRLFAERGFEAVTIADVADEADVAVQTVFNHFCTKEELYFADRTPWVDGPARAVAGRRPGTGAVATVQSWMAHQVMAYPAMIGWADRRQYVDVLQASASLRVHERELLRRCEHQLSRALHATWTQQLEGDVPNLRLPADLISGVLVAAGRVMVVEQRRLAMGPEPSLTRRAEVDGLTLGAIEAIGLGIQRVAARPDAPLALQLVAGLEKDAPPDEDVAAQFVPGHDGHDGGAGAA